MQIRSIDKGFQITISGKEEWHPMTVPGSAMDTWYREGLLPDPYYRTNERIWKEFFYNDFDIRGTFTVTKEELKEEQLLLIFYGVDTLADIFLNGVKLGHIENMHRTFEFPVKGIAKEGENLLEIHLASTLRYIDDYKPAPGREITMVNTGSLFGAQYLRKAHSMFGWDWGAQLPDAGIFRKIELRAFGKARLLDTYIRQEHADGKVTLRFETEVENRGVESGVTYAVYAPDGQKVYEGTDTEVRIENPALWWPRGTGNQPLYRVTVTLRPDGEAPETREYRVGLRTVTVSQEPDQWGSEFAITVNGVKIFALGADYIPEDCFYPRITKEVLERNIKDAVFANFNCLRVWGGGYYPADEFYDLCDENGILLWQDLMYACNIYDLNDAFIANIEQETRDNLRRFRNHACLALISGNNEMETAWLYWEQTKYHSASLKRDYLIQFEYILPRVVKEIAPDTFYWPSSPSSGGSFDDPGAEGRGDAHYWDVWHGQKPFSDYLKYYFRFCSEFGFQSLPPMKTIESFTEPADRNLFSEVMESHQKNPAANGKILYYLSETFRYPYKLEGLVFLSQILQGYAMKVATEHWRRNRGRCMGSIYWQFNDNWPVASWSSVDYYGRYKALHYMARVFCSPVAGSIQKKGTKMSFWISNETRKDVTVRVKFALKTLDFAVLDETETTVTVPALTAAEMIGKDFAEQVKGRETEVFVVAEYACEGGSGREFETFVPMKHVNLRDPQLTVRRLEGGKVELAARSFAPYCMLEGVDADVVWKDNVVALTDEKPVVLVPVEGDEEKETKVRVYDVYHTYA